MKKRQIVKQLAQTNQDFDELLSAVESYGKGLDELRESVSRLHDITRIMAASLDLANRRLAALEQAVSKDLMDKPMP